MRSSQCPSWWFWGPETTLLVRHLFCPRSEGLQEDENLHRWKIQEWKCTQATWVEQQVWGLSSRLQAIAQGCWSGSLPAVLHRLDIHQDHESCRQCPGNSECPNRAQEKKHSQTMAILSSPSDFCWLTLTNRDVQTFGFSGPHWKKICLGPHIKYTNTHEN